jgi:CRP-like cAMP-binding protein
MDDTNKNKYKALIVDDDTDLLEMLSEILTTAGLEVVTATDGVDGSLKYNNETFDIILSDIKMPRKDGIKFVESIQASEAQKMMKVGNTFKATPIILITASAEEYKVELEVLENIEILTKPFSPTVVIEKVTKLLERKLSTNTAESGTILTFKAGEYLIHEGEIGTDLYFVKEGSFNVMKKSQDGSDVVVTTVKGGEMVGEMGFILHKKRTASVVAVTDSLIISIPKEKFEAVLLAQPKWFKILFETISTRLEETTKLLVEAKSKT